MKTTIGKFDPATGTVPVTFVHAGVTHRRPVNAVRGADGAFDAAATRIRVAEVAAGVEAKIASGAIVNPADLEPPAAAAGEE